MTLIRYMIVFGCSVQLISLIECSDLVHMQRLNTRGEQKASDER